MTIIVTYACYPVVIQVADRRLTLPDGTLVDDDTTKSVLWDHSWLIGYTGLARIQGKPTYQWIAELLANHHQQLKAGYLDRNLALLGKEIANALTAERVKPSCKMLAIVGAGWGVPWDVGEPPPAGLRPYIWHLSNFHDKEGNSTCQIRSTVDFQVARGRPLKKTEMGVLTHGQEMNPMLWSKLCRLLRKARIRALGPNAPARLIVDAVQRMENPRVGKSLLICSLPVPTAQRDQFVLNERPNLARPSFWYSQPDGEWRVQRGPIFVDGGNIEEIIEARYGDAVSWPGKVRPDALR
ncbi:MAG: hypothetical protein WD795_03700 [Woeseia sp.]